MTNSGRPSATDIEPIRGLLDACEYEPISDYAVIGDCHSAALVSRCGSIDWMCMPHFSAPSVFAALLDRRRGGRFLIRPRDVQRVERRYVGRSAVLETTFHCADGMLKLTDFMPVPLAEDSFHRLFRLVDCEQGEVAVDVAYQPRPDYARSAPDIEMHGDSGWLFRHADESFLLHTDAPLAMNDGRDLVAGTCYLSAGQRRRFVFACAQAPQEATVDFGEGDAQRDETVRWWEAWCGQCTYDGPNLEMLMRSCLTLKLLTHEPTGAVMAALTTSLPESLHAGRNWDYRYCWLRDTSLLLQSFIDMGFERESGAFLSWLLKVCRKPRLQPLYDLDAQPAPDEYTLPHLEGYRGVGPVRIGNSAHQQLQLDIYGELIQTAYRFVSRGGELSDDEKRMLISLGDSVCRLWREPDQSIWEARSEPRHYTYSKLMCWVALERLLALNECIALDIDARALRDERDRIRNAIESNGFDVGLGSYVGYFGGTEPDASLLLMLRYGYVQADDPRIEGTYRYIMKELSADGFLYRYPPGKAYDGIENGENLFVVCSFWAVDYLARSGRIDEATALYERLLALANDVGLYPEQFAAGSLEARGNFPQAFSHSGVVTAGLAIKNAQKGKKGHEIPA